MSIGGRAAEINLTRGAFVAAQAAAAPLGRGARRVMSKPATIVRRALVEGLVQGVGYREFTRRWALRLGVSGWVRNRSDGAVEALVAGGAAAVEAMLAHMRVGPPGAEVLAMRVDEADGEETGEGFDVRRTV
jgi:acylphosphatase